MERRNLPNQKSIILGDAAKQYLIDGVNILANLTKATLGPGGKTIVLEDTMGQPTVTKDGVTVAKSVQLRNPERQGAEMLKLAAHRMGKEMGDGTTSVTVLSQALVNEGFDRLKKENLTPNKLIQELLQDKELAKAYLKHDVKTYHINTDKFDKDSHEIVERLIMTSSNNDKEMTDLIIEAYKAAQWSGSVLVEDARSHKSRVEASEGHKYDRGWYTDEFRESETDRYLSLNNCKVLIYDRKVERMEHIMPVIKQCGKNEESLLIICDDIDHQILQQIVGNNKRGGTKIIVVKAPAYGEHRIVHLKDMAALTSATLLLQSEGLDLSDLRYEDLGDCNEVKINSEEFILIEPNINQEEFKRQCENAEAILKNPNVVDWEKNQTRIRLSKLNGKVATIYVGGYTELDVKEKKDRYDDAIRAVAVALKDGVVAGGGLTLLKLRKEVTPEGVLYKCLSSVIETIFCNIGKDFKEEQVSSILEESAGGYTFNNNNIVVVQMDDALPRILDPKGVIEAILDTAVSVASSILMNEGIVLSPVDISTEYSKSELEFTKQLAGQDSY